MRLNEEWKTYFRTLLLSDSSALREYFDQGYIRYLMQQHLEGTRDNSAKILRLATFDLSLRRFLTR
jgi:hypothetical protein